MKYIFKNYIFHCNKIISIIILIKIIKISYLAYLYSSLYITIFKIPEKIFN